jgi:hypothetical protein
MKKVVITEEQIKKVLDDILLNEELSKVSRQDFGRVQFKIEELQNSLNETMKEFRKLQDSMPSGLKTVTNKKLINISQYLIGAQGNIVVLKDAVKTHKRKVYNQQIEEKKK